VAFLNWRFGLTQTTAWMIEVAPVQICRTWLPPHKSYHHHPNHSIWMWEW
jgi:hypothetical protein